jgi:hypothetical protein
MPLAFHFQVMVSVWLVSWTCSSRRQSSRYSPNFVDAKGAVDVAGPAMGKEAFSDKPCAAAALGDASVQVWRDLADRAPVDPAVLPEESRAAVANGHVSRGEEKTEVKF